MPSATASTSLGFLAAILSILLLLAACDLQYGDGFDSFVNCEDVYLNHHDPLVQTGDVTGVFSPAVVQQGDTYFLFFLGPRHSGAALR